MTSPRPRSGTEHLDRRDADAAITRATLRDIARANVLFGARAAVRAGLAALLPHGMPPHPLTVLDVGAGVGDIAVFLRRAMAEGGGLRMVAFDHLRTAASLCREHGVPAVVGDLHALPFRARSVDIVVVSQVLHHLDDDDQVRFLQVLAGLARVGVVAADIRRSPIAAAGIRLASYALRFHPVTRRDGVVSVRRGFSGPELENVLRRSGVVGRVFRRWGWRLVAVCPTTHAHD